MEYPLELTSYKLGYATWIRDSKGAEIFQSDGVSIFARLYNANSVYKVNSVEITRIFSMSPKIYLRDVSEEFQVTIQRNALPSLLQSSYDVLVNNTLMVKIQEGKALSKIFGGKFDGTFFESIAEKVWQPTFIICRPNNQILATLEKRKRRSFLETRFTIKKTREFSDAEERAILLSLFGFIWFEHVAS
jgi:hypothetical protein